MQQACNSTYFRIKYQTMQTKKTSYCKISRLYFIIDSCNFILTTKYSEHRTIYIKKLHREFSILACIYNIINNGHISNQLEYGINLLDRRKNA